MKDVNYTRIALVTGTILLIPLLAMQLTDEVNWNLFDFIVVGVMLIGTGLIYELFVNRLPTPRQRLVAGLVLLAALLLAWAELSVGIFGSPFAGS